MLKAHIIVVILLSYVPVSNSSAALPDIKGLKEAAKKPAQSFDLALRASYRENFKGLTSAQLKKLKEKNECQTDHSAKEKAVPSKILKIGYLMGKRCGFKSVHGMLMFNDSSTSLANIGSEPIGGKTYKAIGLNLPKLSEYKMGATYLTVGHEWAHEIQRFQATKKTKFSGKELQHNQEIEVFCDKTAALKRNCKKCTEQFMQYFIDKHNADPTQLAGFTTEGITLEYISAIPDKRLGFLIASATKASRECEETHPSRLERILRLSQLARGIKSYCVKHKPKNNKSHK